MHETVSVRWHQEGINHHDDPCKREREEVSGGVDTVASVPRRGKSRCYGDTSSDNGCATCSNTAICCSVGDSTIQALKVRGTCLPGKYTRRLALSGMWPTGAPTTVTSADPVANTVMMQRSTLLKHCGNIA